MKGDLTRRELRSQPAAWAALLGRLQDGTLRLPFDPARCDEIMLLGSGTSYYLALAVADWMRRRGFAARAVPSCEAMLDPYESAPRPGRRLAIGFSRSGRSSELILAGDALRKAGFELAGVSCTEGSDLLRQVDHPVLIGEGQEEGLVMLRSLTSMLIALQWLTGEEADRTALAPLPDAGREMLTRDGEALGHLASARDFDRFVFLGSGPSYPLACEAALKIQEMAIATSEAYHSLDYRHGPQACADAATMVTLFALPDREHGLALARDLKALGAGLMVVGPDAAGYDGVADGVVATPQGVSEAQAAALMLLPVQSFALATALRRGKDPDRPVNLSKVVTF